MSPSKHLLAVSNSDHSTATDGGSSLTTAAVKVEVDAVTVHSKTEPTGRVASSAHKITAELEAVLGYVAGEYACSYRNINGSLFAGSKALYFVGSYFWFDRKIILAWDDIRKVEKVEHGLLVKCAADAVHEFTGLHFPDLDRVWLLLISLHNDAIMGRPPREAQPTQAHPPGASSANGGDGSTCTQTPRGGTHALRRRQSDPLLTSMIRMLDDSLIDDEDHPHQHTDGSSVVATSPQDSATGGPALSRRSPPPHPIGESLIWSTAGLDMEDVERQAGKLSLQPIPCTYESIKGKLYAGKAAVYFFGRKIFWDKKEVFLKWESIRQIQMIDAPSTARHPNGGDAADDEDGDDDPLNSSSVSVVCVGIHIVTKDDDVHRFLRMEQADRVWATLVALHNENLTARWEDRHQQQQHHRRSSRSLRRLNSDPNLAGLSPRVLAESPAAPPKLASIAIPADAQSIPVRVEPPAHPVKPTDPAADWRDLQARPPLTYVVVQEHVLHCSLDQAFKLFFQDNAEHSLAKFLESRGDSNLRESLWQAEDGAPSSSTALSRIVHYTHPVNAPLAPPTANARKEQTYRRFGDLGLCLWTKTIVDDVPMADCFYVSDRVRVEALGNDKVKVYMDFELTFVKSTMFKGIISKTTSSEVTALLQAFASYMSSALGEAAAEPKPALPLIASAEPSDRAHVGRVEATFQSHAALWLLAAIVLLQLWMLGELREVKLALRKLHEQALLGSSDGTCADPM